MLLARRQGYLGRSRMESTGYLLNRPYSSVD
jgi:hypothetical protein